MHFSSLCVQSPGTSRVFWGDFLEVVQIRVTKFVSFNIVAVSSCNLKWPKIVYCGHVQLQHVHQLLVR